MIKHCVDFSFTIVALLWFSFWGATGYMTVHLFSYHEICCSAVAENCLSRMGAPSLLPLKNKTKKTLDGTKLLCWQNIMAASHRAGLFEGGFARENKSWLINGRALDFFFFTCEQMYLSPLYLPPVFTTKPRLSGEGEQSATLGVWLRDRNHAVIQMVGGCSLI